MPLSTSLSEQINHAAHHAGFCLAGISAVRDFDELAHFAPWISAGYAGEMRYLQARTQDGQLKRSSLANAVPWAKSIVVCAINYNSQEAYSTEMPNGACGWISRYAWSQSDYHDVVLTRLRALEARIHELCADPGLRSWSYVDTGPLVERIFAKYAGIGWIGKNTCIINQQAGSWLFLGVVLLSLPLTPDLPAPDRCGTCTRCIDACPTNAFVAPHMLDASRCISYLTIEKRGSIPEDLRPAMGRHLFGCDICQDVCPWNRKAPATTAPDFMPREGLINPPLEWIASMTVEDFQQTFRGSPVKRTTYSGLRRNCAIAMSNSGDPKFLPYLESLAKDDDPTVAEHARWALTRLRAVQDAPAEMSEIGASISEAGAGGS
jgi:epoxyqueuosine reductase